MNLIIMEKNIDKSEEDQKEMIPNYLTMPPKIPDREIPFFGMVPIPQHDFPEQFSNFCFRSLYIKEEVIKAMVEIRTECNMLLLENKLFDCKIEGNKRLEEFKQIQNSSIGTIKVNTSETGWVGKLKNIIQLSFTDVGKGWFNIHETSKETYEFGKLKKFLTLINFMMQDSVLTMCQDSVKEFVSFILNFIPYKTKIITTAEVHNFFEKNNIGDEDQEQAKIVQMQKKDIPLEEQDFSKNKDPEPLFVLDLVLKPNQLIPHYSTDPHEVVRCMLEIFDAGIKVLQEIPQLEPILLKNIFKTHGKKMLKAPVRPI